MHRVTAKSSATVISATASALRPGRAQHRDPGGGGGGDVDVVGVAPARADREQRQVEDRALHAVGLHDEQVGALGLDPGRQLLGVVEAQGLLVDPRVEHDVGEALERVAGLRRGTARSRALCVPRGRSSHSGADAPVRWHDFHLTTIVDKMFDVKTVDELTTRFRAQGCGSRRSARRSSACSTASTPTPRSSRSTRRPAPRCPPSRARPCTRPSTTSKRWAR